MNQLVRDLDCIMTYIIYALNLPHSSEWNFVYLRMRKQARLKGEDLITALVR